MASLNQRVSDEKEAEIQKIQKSYYTEKLEAQRLSEIYINQQLALT